MSVCSLTPRYVLPTTAGVCAHHRLWTLGRQLIGPFARQPFEPFEPVSNWIPRDGRSTNERQSVSHAGALGLPHHPPREWLTVHPGSESERIHELREVVLPTILRHFVP